MMTGAPATPSRARPASQSGSAMASQNNAVSSPPCSTTKAQPWLNPADGARTALATIRSTAATGTGRSTNRRTILRRRTTSWKSTSSDFDEDPLLPQDVGHQPPQPGDHQRVDQRSQQEAEVGRVQVVVQPDPPAVGLELGGEDLRPDV